MPEINQNVLTHSTSNKCSIHCQVPWLHCEDLLSPTKYYRQRSISPVLKNQQDPQACSLKRNNDLAMKCVNESFDYMIQEPVRIFLERLHPQKKLYHHSNPCFTNTESVGNNKSANPIYEVKTTSISVLLARNHFQSLEHCMTEINLILRLQNQE